MMNHKTRWRETALLWLFSLRKLPLVFWLRPRIVEMGQTRSVLKIRFTRRTRNHVNSMYFGALCVGAELAPGTLAMNLLRAQPEKYTFVFKDFYAEFLKRCEADVYFVFEQGEKIEQAIARAKASGERENVALDVVAVIPSESSEEPVAKFKLTLSLKKRA